MSIVSVQKHRNLDHKLQDSSIQLQTSKTTNQVGTVVLYGVPIVSLVIESQERLCLAQISNTLLKEYSYNEIHNRRVALGITCVQCTPVQLEILRRAGAMPVSSRRCGMITRREAERLCKSFLGDNSPPRLPDDFAFSVHHECAWGCRGSFLPSRYNSSRAKCIKCAICGLFFSPNKFIFHSHRTGPTAKYVQPDAANFNSWRRHMRLSGSPPEEIVHAWEDVKAMFNGGTRKRMLASATNSDHSHVPSAKSQQRPEIPTPPFPIPSAPPPTRVPPLPLVMDYVWHHTGIYPGMKHGVPYCLPWLTPSPLLLPPPNSDAKLHTSAFRPVFSTTKEQTPPSSPAQSEDEETVDIETCPEDELKPGWNNEQKIPPNGMGIEGTPIRECDISTNSSKVEEKEKVNELQSAIRIGSGDSEEKIGRSRMWGENQEPMAIPESYSNRMARQLHLMRELVSPNKDLSLSSTPFLQFGMQPPHRPRDKALSSSDHMNICNKNNMDCTACNQIADIYSGIIPNIPQQSSSVSESN